MGRQPKGAAREFLRRCIAGTDSDLEWKAIKALRKHGFVTEQNQRVGGYRWDICLRSLKVLIDVNSRKYHGSEHSRAFVVDRWKTNHAQLLGWTALRITDECVDFNIADVIGLLQRIERFRQDKPTARLLGIAQQPVWTWHLTLHSSEH